VQAPKRDWRGSLINVLLVLVGGIAVAILVPESRSSDRVFLDPLGVLLSSLGLLALTFGFIRAGQDGWGNAAAVVMIAAGIVLIAGFAPWQRLPHRIMSEQERTICTHSP